MDRLITREQVADFMNQDATASMESSISHAEELVAGYIGSESLYERTQTDRITVLYEMDGDEVLELSQGPAVELTALTISDIAIALDSNGLSDDVILKPWTLRYLPGLAANDEVVIEYLAGWTASNLPRKMTEALIAASALVVSYPSMLAISERIGDYTIQYADAMQQREVYGLNTRICLLLKQFKKSERV